MKEKLSNIRKSIVQILGGDFLVRDFFRKNILFLVFIAIMAIVSIHHNYTTRRQLAEMHRLRAELRVVRYEALVESAELARIGRQEEVERRLRAAGITNLTVTGEPVYYIQRRGRRR